MKWLLTFVILYKRPITTARNSQTSDKNQRLVVCDRVTCIYNAENETERIPFFYGISIMQKSYELQFKSLKCIIYVQLRNLFFSADLIQKMLISFGISALYILPVHSYLRNLRNIILKRKQSNSKPFYVRVFEFDLIINLILKFVNS